MKKTITAVCAAGVLILAACNDDDGGDASGAQAEAAQQALDAAEEGGFQLDESCVNDLAQQLSDDDAQAIVDAGPEGDAVLSEEGQALTDELLDCVDQDAFVDLIVEQLAASGQAFDEECLRNALEGVDLGSFDPDNPPPEFVTAVTECVEL